MVQCNVIKYTAQHHYQGLLAVAHQLDAALGVDYIMLAATYGFIANESLSIVENAGLMGIVKSDVIINAIDVIKGKSQKK